MIFVKQTIEYLKKNILFLTVFALIPSVMYTINNTSLNIFNFYNGIRKGNGFNFLDAYKSFSTINYNSLFLSLLSVISTIVFVALIMAFIEKHMRIGRRSFKSVVGKLNDNIMPVFLLIMLFIVIYELWAVILSALTVMAELIFSGTLLYIISIIIGLGFFVLLFMLLGVFVLWLPCILITGFNYSEAFIYSASLMSDKKKEIAVSLAVPYVLCNMVALIVNMFLGNTAGMVVLICAFILYFIYYTSLMYVIYFSLTNEKREDLKKNIFKR